MAGIGCLAEPCLRRLTHCDLTGRDCEYEEVVVIWAAGRPEVERESSAGVSGGSGRGGVLRECVPLSRWAECGFGGRAAAAGRAVTVNRRRLRAEHVCRRPARCR